MSKLIKDIQMWLGYMSQEQDMLLVRARDNLLDTRDALQELWNYHESGGHDGDLSQIEAKVKEVLSV